MRRRTSDQVIPWWRDRHAWNAILQPFLAVAIVQAPDWLQPWIAAGWSALAGLGIISARQAEGTVGIAPKDQS